MHPVMLKVKATNERQGGNLGESQLLIQKLFKTQTVGEETALHINGIFLVRNEVEALDNNARANRFLTCTRMCTMQEI